MVGSLFDIIKRPLISEKNTVHMAGNVYAFEVQREATKDDVAKAVEKMFRVNVEEVRTMNSRGRVRRMGRFTSGVRKYKKALVRLQSGQKIKLFEGA